MLVIAKRPVAGRVKTRLTPPCTPEQAAAVAAAALRDTLRVAGQVAARHHVLVWDGDPDGWVPPDWDVVAQVDGGLDRRLCAAFTGVADHGPALLIGMDTPQADGDVLRRFAPGRFDACLGPTEDGGFWVLGLREPARAVDVLPGVPMSTDGTFAQQRRRLVAAGLSVQPLPGLVDVDTASTAAAVAAGAPHTEFARSWRRVTVASA